MFQARSFESAIDQGEDTDDGQYHRLEQYHADSGYRSIENPSYFSQQSFSEVTGRQIPSVSFELSTSDSYSSSDLEGSTKLEDILEGTNELRVGTYSKSSGYYQEKDKGVTEMHSTPCVTTSSTDMSTTWERCQRKNHRSASRKRREFGVGGGHRALAHVVSEVEYMHPQFFKSYGSIYRRDYSVDKKSDALFQEFSRCEPVKTRHRQLTQSYIYSHAEHSKRLSESVISDQDICTVEANTDRTEIPVLTLDNNDIIDEDDV